MNEPLSPAAQAVFSAWQEASDGHYSEGEWIPNVSGQLAAALRAATDHGEYMVDPVDGKTAVVRVADLQAWATELEGPNA